MREQNTQSPQDSSTSTSGINSPQKKEAKKEDGVKKDMSGECSTQSESCSSCTTK